MSKIVTVKHEKTNENHALVVYVGVARHDVLSSKCGGYFASATIEKAADELCKVLALVGGVERRPDLTKRDFDFE